MAKLGDLLMVVDDSPDVRLTIVTILKKNGYEVVEASSGDDCLKKLSVMKKKPKLILMDIMMPGTPVKEVVKKIKGIKIAFISVVRTTDAEKEELMQSKNIVGYIQKPFEIDDLLKQVKKLLK
jgi:two-component system response regulator (stage 0 sporulation protein F)